jgi:FMN phosphatase YigB (HAD superfamily)
MAGGSYFRGAMKEIGISDYAPYDCVGEFLYPEAESVLKRLSERYHLGIIANQPLGTKERLYEYGIGQYFSLVLSSAEEGLEKPNRALFLRALSLSGCEAADAVMVGDRPDNDIVPAKALGMKTVRITQGLGGLMPVTSDEMRADMTISSLNELLAFFYL